MQDGRGEYYPGLLFFFSADASQTLLFDVPLRSGGRAADLPVADEKYFTGVLESVGPNRSMKMYVYPPSIRSPPKFRRWNGLLFRSTDRVPI
jgi:hypothetical protein